MSTDDWCTPPEVCDRLHEIWSGRRIFDPCSNPRSIVRAHKALTAAGLNLPWRPNTFENNPYSQMLAWQEKGARELALGNVEELITLWPVATSAKWWKQAVGLVPIPPVVKGGKEITVSNPTLVFPKRLAFIDERGRQVKGCRFDSVLFFYGKSEKRHKMFRHVFSGITNWWGRGR